MCREPGSDEGREFKDFAPPAVTSRVWVVVTLLKRTLSLSRDPVTAVGFAAPGPRPCARASDEGGRRLLKCWHFFPPRTVSLHVGLNS